MAVAPATVSQLSSAQILGVDARRFLDVVVPACRPHVAHVGKLRVVEVEIAVEALRRLAPAGDEAAIDDRAERQPETASEVLAALGREVA